MLSNVVWTLFYSMSYVYFIAFYCLSFVPAIPGKKGKYSILLFSRFAQRWREGGCREPTLSLKTEDKAGVVFLAFLFW